MTHPISKFNSFDEVYHALEKNVTNGFIDSKTNGNLVLYNYNNHCVFEHEWNDATRIARGLVLDIINKKIVALPFPKFFNEGWEHYAYGLDHGKFNENGFFEKMDGSCGVIYYHNGDWQVNTRGSFDSDQAIWAKNYLDKNIKKDVLSKNITYIVEIIYNQNKIVVDYKGKEGLVLIGGYNNISMNEEFKYYISLISKATSGGFLYPKQYRFKSLEEAKEATNSFDKNQEGFVYRCQNGIRCKIKGAEYCRVHSLISHHSPLFLWRCFMEDGLDKCIERKKDLPEEFWLEYDIWLGIMVKNYKFIKKSITVDYLKYASDFSDKDLGLAIKSGKINSSWASWFFRYRKVRGEFAEYGSKEYQSICKLFEPKSNQLIKLY